MRSKPTLVVTILVLIIGLLAATALSGCGSDKDAGTPSETGAATDGASAFEGEIVVGALGTMTGSGAMGGAEQIWAYNKAVADINAKGGIKLADGKSYELKLKWIDDKSESTEGAAAVEKLIKAEGIKVILSTQVTPINLAAATVVEKYQAYYHMCVAWRNVVEEQGYKWVSDFFFTPAEVSEVPFQMVELQPEADRPTKWAIFTEDNADGQALGEGVKAIAAGHGITPVVYETYTPGSKDYSSSILKMKQNGVDAIVTLISPADGITFTKQMKEQDFAPKFMMGWKGFWPTEYMQGLGADSDFVCFDAFWSEDLPNPGAKELGEAYKAEHDGLDSVSIGLFYANVQTLAMAIEKAGSTEPAAIRDAVFGGTFPGTVMGDVTYSANGTAPVVPLGLQWMGGARVVVYPDQGNQMEWFKAWGQR